VRFDDVNNPLKIHMLRNQTFKAFSQRVVSGTRIDCIKAENFDFGTLITKSSLVCHNRDRLTSTKA
jgi:hypothetical protein